MSEEMLEKRRRQVIANYLSAYNAGDIEGMLVLLTPDVHFENHFNGELNASAQGARQFREVARAGLEQFEQRDQKLVDLRVDGQEALARIEFRGLLTNDLPPGSVAGTWLHLQGTTEFTFHGDLIGRIVDRSHAAGREGEEPVA